MTCRTSSSKCLATGKEGAFAAPSSPGALLASIPATLRRQPVYSYIVTTITTSRPNYLLQQTGSAPNFDGGRITLCTCKHKDRATIRLSADPLDPWKHVWVAGITSKTEDPSRSLAYLMLVERSFLSQADLWAWLSKPCQRAKSACNSASGDLYEPKTAALKDAHDPASYRAPVPGHVHSAGNMWYHDITRWGRIEKPHRLLLGVADQSYRWTCVKIILKLNAIGASAHHRIFASLDAFVASLQEFDP